MSTTYKRSTVYGIWLIIAAVIGFAAAFALTLDKLESLVKPTAAASCDFSVIVQCSANLASAQGSVFGFPNPLIGLAAWPFVLVTGVLVLANIGLPKFYWYSFLGGVTFAISFVAWLITQSVFFLGTLCPWCMVTWIAVIPTFLSTVAHLGSIGLFGERLTRYFDVAKSYVPVTAFALFVAIALIAQLRLDWIATL